MENRMDKGRLLHRWVLITGSLISLLGIAHLVIAVPMGIEFVKSLPVDAAHALTLGNIVTAIAVFGAGLLTIYCVSGLKRAERWAWTIAVGAGIFMILVGIGYIIVTPHNPFAYLAFVVALCALAPLMLFRQSHLHH
jgi:hypothetical protein